MHIRSQLQTNIDKAIADLSTDKILKVGWPKNIRYPADQGGRYVAEIAAQNEWGAPHLHIPARPFMRPAIIKNKNAWVSLLKKGVKQVFRGNKTILEVLDDVGSVAAGDVKLAIQAVVSPPLSPYTIAMRLAKYSNGGKVGGLTKPLIDTGIMINSVTHALEKE